MITAASCEHKVHDSPKQNKGGQNDLTTIHRIALQRNGVDELYVLPALREAGDSTRSRVLSGITDFLQLFRSELDIQRAEVLFEILRQVIHESFPNVLSTYLLLRSPRDWDNIVALSKQPSERDLPRGGIMSLADFFQRIDQLENVREILFRVLWNNAADIDLIKVVRTFLNTKRMINLRTLSREDNLRIYP